MNNYRKLYISALGKLNFHTLYLYWLLSHIPLGEIPNFLFLLSYMQGSMPAIKLPIIVANIARGKHGSASGAYDTDGKFVPQKFEEIFQKHAHTHPDALTSDELKEMLKANQQPNDLPGSFASRTEWEILFSIAKDKDGLLQKDTVRSVYDGSLFYKLEAEKKSLK